MLTSFYSMEGKVKARTMMYLDAEQLRALKDEAHTRGISLAELLRRVVQAHLEERPAVAAAPPSAFLKIVGLGASGCEEISDRHDSYVAEALRLEHAG